MMHSTDIFQKRITAVRSELQKRNLDAFVSTFLPTTRYLCGYSGSNGLLIVTRNSSHFFTDFRYQQIVQSEVHSDEKTIGAGSLIAVAAKKKVFTRLKKIGFDKEHLTVSDLEHFRIFIDGKKLIGVSGIVEQLRTVKDDSEMRKLKLAFDISDRVFQKILGIIKPGLSELDMSAEISYLHKKFHAENDSFDVIVASGVRGSLPHGTASSKKIRTGEFVTLDFGCVVDGYHSDMTRTICVGTPTVEMKKVYRIVLVAQQKACNSVRAGIRCAKIDSIARKHISSKGYRKYFGHSLGHGVGLEIHELPRVAPKSKERLVSGNVITIEPGIYLPNKFGIRIEDTVVVREDGCEVLTMSPKNLIVI